jgi:UDP-3-O-[3-hydroxymyristoyl] glucosamine N-acyltransferase
LPATNRPEFSGKDALLKTITLRELAQLVNGELDGDGDLVIHGAAIIRDATAQDITLADSEKLVDQLAGCPAAAVLVPDSFQPSDRPRITVADVHHAFTRIVRFFRPARKVKHVGISPAAHVSPLARIAPDAQIHAGAVVGDDVEIGAGCVVHSNVTIMPGSRLADRVELFPNVVLYENTVVGSRSVIHAGAVIGAYGFGYRTVDGRHQRGPQLGNVEIGSDVEIGAGTTIDRGTYGATVIGDGTKIDNQVMIGHNCRIGKHNLLCSQVGIAGSCSSGDYVVMAGQVGIADHIDVGDRAMLGAKSGVMHNIPVGETWLGIPAAPQREQFQNWSVLRKMPEIRRTVRHLEQQVESLRARIEDKRADAA